jgi:hypothetical protein
VKRLIDEQLSWQFAHPPVQTEDEWAFWKKFIDAIEIKPGIGWVKIDLKKALGH